MTQSRIKIPFRARREHLRKGCVARVLYHGDALLCLSAVGRPRAVTQRNHEDGADCSGTTAEAAKALGLAISLPLVGDET